MSEPQAAAIVAPNAVPDSAARGGGRSRMAALIARVDALLDGAGVRLAKKKRGDEEKVIAAVDRTAGLSEAERNTLDVEIRVAFFDINTEQERAANFAAADHSLERLNGFLARLGRAEEPSKTKARKALRSVMINIYDLVDGQDVVFATLAELRDYTIAGRLFFPRGLAKSAGMRDFLRVIFGRGGR